MRALSRRNFKSLFSRPQHHLLRLRGAHQPIHVVTVLRLTVDDRPDVWRLWAALVEQFGQGRCSSSASPSMIEAKCFDQERSCSTLATTLHSNTTREKRRGQPSHRLQGGARAFPQKRQRLHRSRGRPPLRALGEGGAGEPRGVAQGRRRGPPPHRRARGVRRGRRRLPLQRRDDRGDGQARVRGPRLPPALRHRRALHPQLRQRGAEARLAAAHGQGRGDHGDCHDRARHGQRPAGDPHHGAAPRQRAGRQRAEDLHHQRRAWPISSSSPPRPTLPPAPRA